MITVLGFGGMFGAFTYIAYTLTEVSGFAAATVPWLLVLFGVGLFVGNLGGRAADAIVARTLLVVLAVLDRGAGRLRADRRQPGDDRRRPGADGRVRFRHGAPVCRCGS